MNCFPVTLQPVILCIWVRDEYAALYTTSEAPAAIGPKKLGLDPAKTTTFEWLEVDDRVSHAQAAA
jgi:hypothetical protein